MKSDPRDYRLDIRSIPKTDAPSPSTSSAQSTARPYLSVLFSCCQVYQRVYKNADGRDYTGRCPKCARTVRFVVGPGGTSGRTFVVE